MITVYSKDYCPQCTAVKAQLKTHDILFDEVPINSWALDVARKNGWTSAPIVIDPDNPDLSFAGNDCQALTALIAAHK